MPNAWNVLLGTPRYSDITLGQTPTLSGGSWVAGLPLTNLQDRRLNLAARSTGVTLANTQFEIDLKIPRPIRVFALPKHTLSLAGYVRIRGWTGAGGTGTNVYDTGWLPGNTKPINLIKSSENLASGDWTNVGTPTLGTPVGVDDVLLDLLGDDDGAAQEYKRQTITFKRDGTKGFSVHAKKGTSQAAAGSQFYLVDSTAGTLRGAFGLLFDAAGVPTLTPANGGVVVETIPKSNGGYRFRVTAAGVIATNVNYVALVPAITLAEQGNVYLGGVQVDPESAPLEYVRTDSAIGGADTTGMNAGFLHVASAPQIARYWVVEIDDTTNAAGYVDVSRLILAGGLQSTINVSYGLKFGLETETERGVTDGGAALYSERPERRLVTGTIENLPESESLQLFYEMQRREGLGRQIMFVYDPSDVYHVHRRSFLSVLRELSPLERAMLGRDNVPLSFVEEL